MTAVDVHASKDYTVFIDELSLDDIGGLARKVSGGDAALIVSDGNVAPRYLARVRASLETAGYPVSTFVFPAGEKSKTLSTFAQPRAPCSSKLRSTLARHLCTPQSPVPAECSWRNGF